jgi:hypothetical protein
MSHHHAHKEVYPRHTVKMKPVIEGDITIVAEDLDDAARQMKEIVRTAYQQHLENCNKYRDEYITKLSRENMEEYERKNQELDGGEYQIVFDKNARALARQ